MTRFLDRLSVEERESLLTAFALGELTGEERSEVEKLVEEDSAALRQVEEVRAVARDLERGYALEMAEAPGLTSAQQAVLFASLPEATEPRPARRSWRVFLAAASLLFACFAVLHFLQSSPERSMEPTPGFETAQNDPGLLHGPPSVPLPQDVTRLQAFGYLTGQDGTIALDGGSMGVFTIDGRRLEIDPRVRFDLGGDPSATGEPVVTDSRSLGESLLLRVGGTRSLAIQPPRTSATVDSLASGLVDEFLVTPGRDSYDRIDENPFHGVKDEPLSTFSIDVDTASYANVRRFLKQGQMPPPDAVRIEELVNYFRYDDPAPTGDDPFAVRLEMAHCPWNLEHRLVRIGFRSREIPQEERPQSNLVFLIDVSGSMDSPDKLPLLVRSLRLLVDQLGENDRVAIVVYAGASGLVLESTSCDEKERIHQALEGLKAGGSTNGGAGIQLAYEQAVRNFIQGGTNRVLLCTDGDFNVGVSDRASLTRLIEEKRSSGVFLSVLGFGQGNLKDSQMEQLADKGNGNYAYIDDLDEGRKVLVREMGATLLPVAKDVKLQVEFNPGVVQAYRLIGYENRILAHQDFNDDAKDAGELGAGTSVTALYEIVPAGVGEGDERAVDPLKYQTERAPSSAAGSDEALTVKVRYKQPDGETSQLLTFPLANTNVAFDDASEDLRFSSAVALFGLLLRRSERAGTATWQTVLELARDAKGADPFGDRQGFLEMVTRLIALQ